MCGSSLRDDMQNGLSYCLAMDDFHRNTGVMNKWINESFSYPHNGVE